jgi:SAM-dependent methyltransferase
LVPFVSEAVGLDLAENMVEEYNKWARENGFGPERMSAHQCDLLAEPDTTTVGEKHEEFSDFDIIAVSMALHHVVNPGLLLQRFAKQLRGTAGVCVVLDMVPTDSNAPNIDGADLSDELRTVLKTVNKRGFTECEMRRLYEDAGLGKNFEYVVIDHPFEFTMFGQKVHITGFIARGELA